MTILQSEIKINATKERIWAVLADFGAVDKFAPGVNKSYYTSEHRQGVGVMRHCDLSPRGEVDERVVNWDEGEGLTLQIQAGRMVPPFKHNTFRYALREDGVITIVSCRFDYTLKYGALGEVANKFLIEPKMKKTLSAMIIGLKYYIEVGQKIDKRVCKKIGSTFERAVKLT